MGRQLDIPGNEASLDEVLGGSKLSVGDQALVKQAPPELRALVEATLASKREHRRSGRTAQHLGEAFERWLIAQHTLMALPGPSRLLAWHLQVHARAKYLPGRGGEKRLTHVERAAADFVMLSVLEHGSVAVVVEAKSIGHAPGGKPGRLSLEELKPQQREHLSETVKHGGLALVAMEYRLFEGKGRADRCLRFAVPWDEMPWRPVRKGSWSIGHDDLSGWEMPPETGPRRAWYLARFLPRTPSSPASLLAPAAA